MKCLKWLTLVLAGFAIACAITTRGPLTLKFQQYTFAEGRSTETQTKSDIEIKVTTMRPGDIYDYPQYFSFNRAALPPAIKEHTYIQRGYPPTVDNKSWEYVLSDPRAEQLLAAFQVELKNNTSHIVRMKDARVYLVKDGEEPIPAMATLDELKDILLQYEREDAVHGGGRVAPEYPVGFLPAVVDHNKRNLKLINGVGRETLPGFTLSGLLIFPVEMSEFDKVQLSFFDITTKTDAAGNPIEKTTFDFELNGEIGAMWFDAASKRWRAGEPPVASK